MQGLGILILIIVFFWLIWPMLSRWLKRKAMERAEDYMRSKMGMPPRDKKKNKREQGSSSQNNYYRQERRNPYGHGRHGNEPLIPKEYAEDVEFTETKDFSESQYQREKTGKVETYHESQISDAEWTEVKEPRSK